jgi:hypothetical protein
LFVNVEPLSAQLATFTFLRIKSFTTGGLPVHLYYYRQVGGIEIYLFNSEITSARARPSKCDGPAWSLSSSTIPQI